MSERLKKYVQIAVIPQECLEELILDSEHTNKLVSKWYTKTTSGGKNVLWEVNEKDNHHFTVSTDSLKSVTVSAYRKVPLYKHYVLTEEGVRYIKEYIMEHA